MTWLCKLVHALEVLRSEVFAKQEQFHVGSTVLLCMPEFHTQGYNLHAQQFAYIKDF